MENNFESYYELLKNNFNNFLNSINEENKETKEAFNLLINSINNDIELTDEEKAKIGEQFKDVLKTIGIVGITILPGGSIFLILTKLLKLNKYILPSSFQKK